MSKLNNTGMFEMMRGTPPPTWEQTCLDLDKKLADSRQHITQLENRLRALWDKYDGDRKHYMDRIKMLDGHIDCLESVGDSLFNGVSRIEAEQRWNKAKEAKP